MRAKNLVSGDETILHVDRTTVKKTLRNPQEAYRSLNYYIVNVSLEWGRTLFQTFSVSCL